jgi:hypothetical protein
MTRLVVYATLGLLLDALVLDYTTWGFWCILALFMCSDYLARRDGYEQGLVHGMSAYINANEQQRADLDKIVKDND